MTREEAIKDIRENIKPIVGGKSLDMAIEALERKRGEWIKENIVLTSNPPQFVWNCSICEKAIHGFNDSVLSNYCPNCGADMRGEENG